jgi:hypothetical protein
MATTDHDRKAAIKMAIEADVANVVDVEGRSDFDVLITAIQSSPELRSEWSKATASLIDELQVSPKNGWWLRLERLIVLAQLAIPKLGDVLEGIISQGKCPYPLDRASVYALLSWCNMPVSAQLISEDNELKVADRVRWLDLILPQIFNVEVAQSLVLEAASEGRFGVEQFIQRLQEMRLISGGRLGDWARRFISALSESQQLEFNRLLSNAFDGPIAANPDVFSRLPSVQLQPPAVAQAWHAFDEGQKKELLLLQTSELLVGNEVRLKDGRDVTHNVFVQETMESYVKTGSLHSGVHLLRNISKAWRDQFSAEAVEKSIGILVERIMGFDRANHVESFIDRTPKGIFRIVAMVSEFHQDRTIMELFKAIMAANRGLAVDIKPLAWGKRFRMAPGIPSIKLTPVLERYAKQKNPMSMIYEFKGYHLFANQRWLQRSLGPSLSSRIMIPREKGRSEVKGVNLDLEQKCSLAIDGGVLNAGAGSIHSLGKHILKAAGRREKVSPVEPASIDVFDAFMRGKINVLLSGAIYAEIIKEWFKDFDIVLMLTPAEIGKVLNYKNGNGNEAWQGCFNRLYGNLNSFSGIWSTECTNVFRLLAHFIDHVTTDSGLDQELKEAWSTFVFSVLAWDVHVEKFQEWAFMPRPSNPPGLFKYDRFMGLGSNSKKRSCKNGS